MVALPSPEVLGVHNLTDDGPRMVEPTQLKVPLVQQFVPGAPRLGHVGGGGGGLGRGVSDGAASHTGHTVQAVSSVQ